MIGIVCFLIREQGETARGWGLESLKINKTPLEPEEVCALGEVCFLSHGVMFMSYCSAGMPRLQPAVAHELLPYLEQKGTRFPWCNYRERRVLILACPGRQNHRQQKRDPGWVLHCPSPGTLDATSGVGSYLII